MKKTKVSVSVIPFEDSILGADDKHVFVRTLYVDGEGDCVVKIPRKEYLRICNLWLDAKADYCKRWNHFCGVMGSVSGEGKQIGEIDVLDEDSILDADDGKTEYIDVPLILVKKFEDHCDMEHG